jgi:dolichol-phosphate mannosyltransferase
MTSPALSVVIPIYDEAPVIPELAQRTAAAASSTGLDFELIFVDDCSRDGSADRVRALATECRARVVALKKNGGQFRATQAGLREARGDVVVVLDGDLQDPPELIPALVAARRDSGARIAWAVKVRRSDPGWFLVALAGFRALRWLVAGRRFPRGAGSFCAFDRGLAQQIANVPLASANLGCVLAALGARGPEVSYEKLARHDGRSHVGALGLAAEALGSLVVLSPPGRWWLARRTRA